MSKQYSRVKGTYTAPRSEVNADKWQQDVKMYQESVEWLEHSISEGSHVDEYSKRLKRNRKKLETLLANNPFTPVGE